MCGVVGCASCVEEKKEPAAAAARRARATDTPPPHTHNSTANKAPYPTHTRTHTQTAHQQQVGQNAAEQARGDDRVQPLLQRGDAQDELDDVAKRRVQQAADDVAEPQREVLGHLAQQQRERDEAAEVLLCCDVVD